jgi:hypothetical protein
MEDNLILTLRILNNDCKNFEVNYELRSEMTLLERPCYL